MIFAVVVKLRNYISGRSLLHLEMPLISFKDCRRGWRLP